MEKKNSRQRHTIGLTTLFDFSKIKSSKTQKRLEFQTIFEQVTLEPLKQFGDLYQSMRLEKSVSKMGLMTLRCWTNDHFIKKH